MRLASTLVFGLGLAVLAGCATPSSEAVAAVPQNLIVVRDFRVTPATRVSVDTSFGFSLDRGHPGVPLRQRAASVARAAAFDIADALTERLHQLGFVVVRAGAQLRDPGGKALIVVGTLREVNEGHRRQVGNEHASVVADVEIDEWAPGLHPLLAVRVDSNRLAGGAKPERTGAPALGVAAARVGRDIARSVAAAAARAGITPAAR